MFLLGFLIVATYAALAILSLTAGYWAGVGSSLPLTRSEFSSTAPQEKTTGEDKESAEGDSESESDSAWGSFSLQTYEMHDTIRILQIAIYV